MSTVSNGGVDLILGAGGPKGFGHLGSLRALEEFKIVPVRIIGVSIGSTIATLYTNKFSVDQSREILLEEMRNFDRSAISRFFRTWNLCQLRRQRGLIDLVSLFERLVAKYGLRPQPNLAILAYELRTRKPILFQGTDYDLVTAIAGSCSVPLMMQPTPLSHAYEASPMRLVDGGVYHPCPVEFSPRPAIVCRLGLASKPPTDKLPWLDTVLHIGERLIRPFWQRRFKQPRPQDILIENGKPDVGTLCFSTSERTFLQMEEYGYQVTKAALSKAIASGKLKV